MIVAQHIPVLLREITEGFREVRGNVLDATFGGGGHARAILDSNPHIQIWAIDCDGEAEQRAEEMKTIYGVRFRFRRTNFSHSSVWEQKFSGILFDLGVSSHQLDQAHRGFSFRLDGPLDMRMDSDGETAKEFLEMATASRLTEAVRDFGEEREWRKIVRRILEGRGRNLFDTTVGLVKYLRPVLGRNTKIHPATRVFQGLRMAVNDELENLQLALPKAFEALEKGGILAVISFHSLEDRRVKRWFNHFAGRSVSREDPTPRQLRVARARLLNLKPIVPDAAERDRNPRSRSAKLRILQKTL
ncbi:MAG: 16S rRNA (cytosine(1402)-N(4))-methyltransferase RsmH [Puniceicoccales bacterium]|jgi:16S rRNA (cytosine1402-N4)-methyltransferase|nr:16S rRNA (cytosine(1402)-N(4))-methyltransferase RsmH [Puniceicoccales bacterium]